MFFHRILWQASASWDGTVQVWDLSQNPPAAICLTGHNESVYDVACSPVEPGILASCGRKGLIAVWDARSQGKFFKPFFHTTNKLASINT